MKKGNLKEDDASIYYYTSNYVLIEWLKNQKIWATRSVSSNDSKDTIYAIEHFESLKKEWDEEYNHILTETKDILNVSRSFSLRLYKDILKDFIANNFKEFVSIIKDIDNVDKICKDGFQLSNKALGCKELIEKLQASGMPIGEDGKIQVKTRNDSPEEMLLGMILDKLSTEEIKRYFNINFELSKHIKNMVSCFLYPYVISFSFNKDNRFLWDSYTNNNGVCLEFSKKELIEYWEGKYKKRNICSKVAYNDTEHKSIIDIFTKSFLKDHKIKWKSEALCGIIPFLKNEYWEPENEFRSVFFAKYFSDEIFEVKENYNLKYNNDFKTQDYIEVDVPLHFIKSITVGPLNSSDDIRQIVVNKLNKDIDDTTKVEEIIKVFDEKVKKSIGTDILKK